MSFSFQRLFAIMRKEFIQMRRDKLTFGMMVGIPVMQLILFGFAINTDPKHLPTAVIMGDHGPFSEAIISGMQQSKYFHILPRAFSEEEGRLMLEEGEVLFVVTVPPDFNRSVIKGLRPDVIIEADATDPSAVGNAVASLRELIPLVIDREIKGSLHHLASRPAAASVNVHLIYNPEGITQYNVVPGLLGVILTMTMVFITSLAITRERERGTMENLLATPLRPGEIMIGKIIPYIFVGYVQIILILAGARYLFNVPIAGDPGMLLAVSLVFIFANLAVGMTFSSLARNQLQAVQLSIFFFLPSILLSGFMFPFRGMPGWAQVIGYMLPLTHFLPIVRGILLKGNTFTQIVPHLIPLSIFMLAALSVGIVKFRQTLE
ncbi:MAG: ABC transporter permease [Spartobacteria bacterium]|nr:ABC transporter permease [Spartobacteria bacterium]